VGALYLRDPHQVGAWGYCPFLKVTGLPCPGCGGLRAVNDLTHGDLVGALGSNAMAVVLVVTVVALGIRWGVRRLLGHPAPFLTSRVAVPFAIAMGVGFVLLGVFRLTPWGAALRP
jgi:hypothetical protein